MGDAHWEKVMPAFQKAQWCLHKHRYEGAKARPKSVQIGQAARKEKNSRKEAVRYQNKTAAPGENPEQQKKHPL